MGYHDDQFQKSIALLNQNKPFEACQILEPLLRETQSRDIGRVLGIAQFKSGMFEQALQTIDALIFSDPTDIHCHQTKWQFFKDLGLSTVFADSTKQSHFVKFLLTLHEVTLAQSENSELSFLLTTIYADLQNTDMMIATAKRHLVQEGISPDLFTHLEQADFAYWHQFNQMRRTSMLDYPSHVAFETYAKCNAKCNFCVYPDMARQGSIMSMDLIKKIIHDLAQIPQSHRFQLSPFAVNEPFLDKRIFEILDLIKADLPNADVTITSNASPLTETNLRRLAQYDLAYLWLSVIDYRRDVYEDKMKLDYDRMITRMDMIHKAKQEGWLKTKVVMSRLEDNTEHDEAYLKFFHDRYPLFSFYLWPYANWLGRTDNETIKAIKPIPCQNWFEFRIDVNGIVQHCCMDGHSEYPWGDVSKNSILEIYNQPKYRQLRMGGKTRFDVDPCNRCNLI